MTESGKSMEEIAAAEKEASRPLAEGELRLTPGHNDSGMYGIFRFDALPMGSEEELAKTLQNLAEELSNTQTKLPLKFSTVQRGLDKLAEFVENNDQSRFESILKVLKPSEVLKQIESVLADLPTQIASTKSFLDLDQVNEIKALLGFEETLDTDQMVETAEAAEAIKQEEAKVFMARYLKSLLARVAQIEEVLPSMKKQLEEAKVALEKLMADSEETFKA